MYKPVDRKRGTDTMKTTTDINRRLRAELLDWFTRQCRDLHSDYYLYYTPTTAEHDGGFTFCKDQPANPDVVRGWDVPCCKGSTVEQNFNMFRPVIDKLPILERG